MKKMLIAIAISSLFVFTGCFSKETDIVKKLKSKINKLDSYNIKGILEVTNNESTYKYDIDVSYLKDEKYRVSLKNKTNQHEQIILKNSSGVYVLTPELNKSFKFQSDWPYSNSQSYLYQTILNDIENDSKVSSKKTKNGYIITTKVNYANNKNLVSQKIYVDENANIKKVEVLDKDGITKIKMTYSKVDTKPSFKDNYFELNGNINIDENNTKETKTTNNILDISYPLYIPENTKLTSQDNVDDKTILTFSGDKSFTIIEQPASIDTNQSAITVSGEIDFINDVIGTVNDQSVSWISGGIEYYATSNTLETEELLEVVNSMNNVTTTK